MLYFDTSFLVPLVRDEATSAKVERFMARLPVGELAISHWTRVEFASLLGRDVRMAGLTSEAAKRADAVFEAVVEESFVVLLQKRATSILQRNISAIIRLVCAPAMHCIWPSPAIAAWRRSSASTRHL
jgi:predicted nucleic acid-binding protein